MGYTALDQGQPGFVGPRSLQRIQQVAPYGSLFDSQSSLRDWWPLAISFEWLLSLPLTVGPTTTSVTKAVATLKGLRSYKTREMARDMHE